MYLYKLPGSNQFIFSKNKSFYHLYTPKDLNSLLPIPEKVYKKHEKHFGKINTQDFQYSALENLKEHFSNAFTENRLNLVQQKLLSFFINSFKITSEQYNAALQAVLTDSNPFEIQVQLAKYKTIKRYVSSSPLQYFLSRMF